jgi:hypothetical protein
MPLEARHQVETAEIARERGDAAIPVRQLEFAVIVQHEQIEVRLVELLDEPAVPQALGPERHHHPVERLDEPRLGRLRPGGDGPDDEQRHGGQNAPGSDELTPCLLVV